MLLSEKTTIQLNGNVYSTEFTVGKVIDAERNKALYSGGQYRNINSITALDAIDILSYVSAFFPEVIKDLKVRSLLDLKPQALKEMRNQLEATFFPWYSAWIKEMQDIQREQLIEAPENEHTT